jgi:tRNA pseudouridine38-40 synthase
MATDFERLRLLVAYDGRGFAGWQSQARRDGVQDALEAALVKITGEDIRVHGSGRTDAPSGKFEPKVWVAALNANLPPLVRVLRVRRVPGGREGFHARFDARGKRYEYRIWNEPWLHPLEIGRAWHVFQPLDFAALRKAAQLFLGKHDFAGFAANRGHEVTDTVRTISRADVKRRGKLITLTFEGDGFLYKMVRLLTGTLARVAQGKAGPEMIQELLAAKTKKKTQFAAPPDGLYLVKVFY